MKRKPIRLGLAFAALLPFAGMATAQAQGASETPGAIARTAVIGYFASWKAGPDSLRVPDLPADRLTHIFYAFGRVTSDGLAALEDPCADAGICPPGERPASQGGKFAQIVALKRAHPHLRVLISLGGWTGSTYFSDAAATAESRERFVKSVVEVFFRPHPGLFDGVDVDWEYPVAGGMPGNIHRAEDRQNFVLLMAELRRRLLEFFASPEKRYELAIAVPASVEKMANLALDELAPLVDWIGVMAYDYHAGADIAGFNAPLFAVPDSPSPELNVDASVRAYLDAGVPPGKLVLGVPFYGRAYGKVRPRHDGLHQSGEAAGAPAWGGEEGIDYRDLAARRPERHGFRRHWNEAAQVPWLYNADERIWISYDDADSITRKAAYARARRLGGIMIWEIDADDGSLLRAVHRALGY